MKRSREDIARGQPSASQERATSEETNPAGTLIMDFLPPELCESNFLVFKPHSLWYFGMAALANSYPG